MLSTPKEVTMEIKQTILTNNPCFKQHSPLTVKGLMLHSVGCAQPNASVFVNAWNKADFNRACVHGFIDANTGVIYQCLPWDVRGWHAGGSANNTHIGVEMCESDAIKYTGGANFTVTDAERAKKHAVTAYKAAVELFAYLCTEYHLDPKTAILSHAEGYKKGVASNHADPEHYWRQLGLPYTMDTFRHDVAEKMNPTVDQPSDWAKESCDKAVKAGIVAGYGNGKFGWKDPITREQFCVILDRLGLLK